MRRLQPNHPTHTTHRRKKVEVTSKKAILREVTLSVAHERMIFGRQEDADMCSVYSANTLVEELEAGTF